MTKKVILVIDDTKEHIIMAKKALEFFDADIVTCEDSTNAMSEIIKYSPRLALVILDLYMPKVNGFDILKYIHKEFLYDRKFKIAIISGVKDRTILTKLAEFKPDLVIIKPYEYKDFKERMSKLLQDKVPLKPAA